VAYINVLAGVFDATYEYTSPPLTDPVFALAIVPDAKLISLYPFIVTSAVFGVTFAIESNGNIDYRFEVAQNYVTAS
jgi:hypothetical protein